MFFYGKKMGEKDGGKDVQTDDLLVTVDVFFMYLLTFWAQQIISSLSFVLKVSKAQPSQSEVGLISELEVPYQQHLHTEHVMNIFPATDCPAFYNSGDVSKGPRNIHLAAYFPDTPGGPSKYMAHLASNSSK